MRFFFRASLSAPGNPEIPGRSSGIFPLPANRQGAAEAAAARSGSRENWFYAEICRILPKIGNHDTATAIHTVQITLGQGLGRSMGAFTKPPSPDCERWDGTGYDRAFGDPHFEADGIWRGDEFIGILFHWNAGGLPLRRASGRLAPPAGTEHGFKSPRGLLPKGGASFWKSTRRRMKSRSAASISTSGWVSSPILRVHPPLVPAAVPSPPAGADELSRPLHTKRPAVSRTSFGNGCSATPSTRIRSCRDCKAAATTCRPRIS